MPKGGPESLGFSQKSNHSTDLYSKTREKVLAFLGANPETHTSWSCRKTR